MDSLQHPINRGDKVLVVGLGKSGLSAVRFFLKQGARVKLSDSSTNPDPATVEWLASVNVEMEFGGHSERFFAESDLVLISPGVPHRLPILEFSRSKGIPVCGELALASQYLKTPVIAITGTNGKTTTTTLVGEILKASGQGVFVGGNIGTPLTDYLNGDQSADWLVWEISSFQLDAAGDFRPDIGILLNITPDHLDRYEGFEEYVLSKKKLFDQQRMADIAIVNSDDLAICDLLGIGDGNVSEGLKSRCLTFGHTSKSKECACYIDSGVSCHCNGTTHDFDLFNTAFANFPNRENGAAAILGCLLVGCSPQAIMAGISNFVPLTHRMDFIRECNGVTYINDSKATNTGAVEAALRGCDRPVILIAGGRDKGGKFADLIPVVSEKVKCMLLIGEAKETMAAYFSDLIQVELCTTLSEAVRRASEVSVSGDVVLLSPACASFDMFSSYVHRGEVFKELVTELTLC